MWIPNSAMREKERERGGGVMSYHSLVSVVIPNNKNLLAPSHYVIFYKRITYDKVAYEKVSVCIILVA